MVDDLDQSTPRRIKSIQNANQLLKIVQSHSDPTLDDICEEVSLSKGSVCTYLKTLEEEGLISCTDGTYQLGLDFLIRGESVRNHIDLYRGGMEVADDLAERTGEWVHLTIEHRGQELTIYETGGDKAIATDYHIQMREVLQYLHSTAAGKSMLAHFDRDYVEKIIDQHGLVKETEHTITDRDTLFEELEQVRELGYAVNAEEVIRGLRAVGAPIHGENNELCGAISLTAPTSRLSGENFEDRIPELVMETSNIIEVNLETASMQTH
ncbi:transcriptional regulator, IclR family [Halogranum amylolyticum]|uniref:Transcriptional regulator, IclR family n=1 Tax=Halogranum amylolyticum TaxID=660520 RepID=A0A1H8WCH9_9EURY|nr:IclR family transcriptional regulator [Halogranum amylolyticum]SEP24828.1 transcriptional regulator, IclR family [Halogranum amylolyticum]